MTTALRPDGVPPEELLSGNRRRQARESFVRRAVGGAAITSILITVGIVGSLVYRAAQFVYHLIRPNEADLAAAGDAPIGFGALWSDQWAPRFFEFDIKTLLVGSLVVTVVAMAVATPLGLGAAVYLSEYANPRVRKVLKPVLEVLAGVPSVVLGFFALRWISPNLVQRIFDAEGQSLLAAGLGVGLLTIPLVASISEDAMRSVPNSLREASAGLGARPKTTTLAVVLPAAVSGLVAAFIVATSRAIGETMVVFLAAGASGNSAQFTANPLERGSTMTAAMASQASGTDGTISELSFNSLFFVGFVLFVITLVLNLIADRYVRRVRQAY